MIRTSMCLRAGLLSGAALLATAGIAVSSPADAHFSARLSVTCDDSDWGADYMTAGRTSGGEGDVLEAQDICSPEAGENGLFEYVCINNRVTSMTVTCPDGCRNGACIGTRPEMACTDTDPDNSTRVKGYVKGGAGDTLEAEDMCISGTDDVNEYYCDGNRIAHVTVTCSGGCRNGACIGGGDEPVSSRAMTSRSTSMPRAGFEDEVRVIDQDLGGTFSFPDVDRWSDIGQAANFLAENGIIGGFPDGTFRAGRYVNRAEAAKFLMLARYSDVEDRRNDGRFWDIPDGEWYVRFVMKAAEEGIINGNPDGSFRPQDTLNTAELLKMITLTFGLQDHSKEHAYRDVPDDAWYAPYAGIAQGYGMFSDREPGYLEPERPLTRGEVAHAIAVVLMARDH